MRGTIVLVRTAVDSSVLLDIFTASSAHSPASARALKAARTNGSLVACEVVWAEVRAHFRTSVAFEETMSNLEIQFVASDSASASLAGEIWQRYRREGGMRERLVPDFLVAAHAQIHADRLLTRDRGFARALFRSLRVIEP